MHKGWWCVCMQKSDIPAVPDYIVGHHTISLEKGGFFVTSFTKGMKVVGATVLVR